MNQITLLLLCMCWLNFACQPTPPATSSQPNVILILTDDQGYGDIARHGNPWIQTPNLDRLYGESLRLTNYHVGTTCAPTRAGLMTGRNGNRNGVWHTISGASLLDSEEETMAEVFANNGYATGMFGKWHLGDIYPLRPQDQGFQETLYHGGGGVGQTPDYWDNDYQDDTYFRNGVAEKQSGYCTEVWFQEGLKFIKEAREKPFFCYLSTNAPHGPYNVAESYRARYDSLDIPETTKRFYGMISQLDEEVGRLMAELEATGLAENTIVIFTTDNGTAQGFWQNADRTAWEGFNAGMRGRKGSPYEGGHRVPCFLRWDNGPWQAGQELAALSAHVDLLPTLAEICGLNFSPNKNLDGQSLLPLLKGETTPKRMLVTDTQRILWPKKDRNSCVMQDQWRLLNRNELYDLRTDPGQETNVAEQHPEQVQAMNAFYDQWWEEIAAEMAYTPLLIGAEEQAMVQLTCHDLIADRVSWNQNKIRNGEADSGGEYAIQVAAAGTYRFSLRRWPEESGLSLGSNGPEASAGSPSWNARPAGEALAISRASLHVGEQQVEKVADREEESVSFELELPTGPTRLTAKFQLADGQEMAAFYVVVEKISG